MLTGERAGQKQDDIDGRLRAFCDSIEPGTRESQYESFENTDPESHATAGDLLSTIAEAPLLTILLIVLISSSVSSHS